MNPCNLNKLLLIMALGLLALASNNHALAAKADRDESVDIDAGYWVDDPEKGFVLFSKDVTMDQGSLHIEAQKATVYRGDQGGGYQRVVLEGEPARWSETLDDGTTVTGQARHIDYNVEEEMVVLRQDVIIIKDGDRISGDLIHYNLDTQMLRGGEREGSGRVRMTISPKKKPES